MGQVQQGRALLTPSGELKNVKGTGSYFIPQGHSCPNDAVLELEI